MLELLRHQAELDQALYPSPVKNLTVLPTAEAESASLLASGPMTRLVDALKQRYRFVIIDSSPLHGSIDSSLLASTADGMVIVAARGRRDAGELIEATRILNTVNARILGVVLSETSTG